MTIPRATDGAPYPPLTGHEPCRSDPDLFFSAGDRQPADAREAKEACGWCHVQQQCLAYALTHAVSGIWGGTTETERRRAQRGNHIPVVPLIPRPDIDLMVRASRRGTPLDVIASLVGRNPGSVERVLREQRQRGAAS